MSKTLSTTLVVIAVLVLAGGLFFFGTLYGRSSFLGLGPIYRTAPNTGDTSGFMPMMRSFGRNSGSAYGPGMMEGNRGFDMPHSPRANAGAGSARGHGMMRGYGYVNADVTPLTVEQARAAAKKYLAALDNPDLSIAEVMIFDNNAYVAVKESSTGIGAFELLVDPVSEAAYPEHGPNMMWNTKYSGLNHANMMGGRGYGMMGSWAGTTTSPTNASADMTVSSQQAVEAAQAFLDANIPGVVATADPIQFYGYYTLDYSKDGKVAGMLSVNGYSGLVMLHTWHGAFIEEAE